MLESVSKREDFCNLPKLVSSTDSILSTSHSNTSQLELVFIVSRIKTTINNYYKKMYN